MQQAPEQRPKRLALLPAEKRAGYRARLLAELVTAPPGWQYDRALWWRYAIAPQERGVLSVGEVAALWMHGKLS